MAPEAVIPDLAMQVVETVTTIIAEIRPKLVHAALSGERGEKTNARHADNFLSTHDVWMHERYRELLTRRFDSFVYASEEADPQIIGTDPEPDLCILVDPLDTSELAVRGILGYTHILIYSRALRRPIISVVGDIFHHIYAYVGFRGNDGHDHAFALTADGDRYDLKPGQGTRLSESLVTNYLMRPSERFVPLSHQTRLLERLSEPDAEGKKRGRIGVDFGSVGLCHVAAGFTEAIIEFAKGFAIWDLSPGHYILHAAGGTVLDLEGNTLSLDYGLNSLHDIHAAMNGRQKFVAAGNSELAQEIVGALR
jgi:myo-inositol-1(or 4)-monophosphatase